jgi:hypothetical protein
MPNNQQLEEIEIRLLLEVEVVGHACPSWPRHAGQGSVTILHKAIVTLQA